MTDLNKQVCLTSMSLQNKFYYRILCGDAHVCKGFCDCSVPKFRPTPCQHALPGPLLWLPFRSPCFQSHLRPFIHDTVARVIFRNTNSNLSKQYLGYRSCPHTGIPSPKQLLYADVSLVTPLLKAFNGSPLPPHSPGSAQPNGTHPARCSSKVPAF